MHCMRAPDGVGADLREPDIAHVALLDELSYRTDRVLDRHARVKSRRTIDVDVVDAQSFQRVRHKIAHSRRPGVIAIELARPRAAQSAEFDAELDSIPIP